MKIAIVGEAYGEHEERVRLPFIGPAGNELTRMLEEAGIRRSDCYLTNVFNLRPTGNDISTLCCNKAEDRSGLPPLVKGKYIRVEYMEHLNRLRDELNQEAPNLVIALGNTACWALLRNTGIANIRGTITAGVLTSHKVLPTYHPAAILRQWDLRHVTILDLMKARFEAEFPEIRRPQRTVYIDPSLHDIRWFINEYLRSARRIAIDIETIGNQITCIGFAPSPSVALVIPFIDHRLNHINQGSYWPGPGTECMAWELVKEICALPAEKVFQNGLYDLRFLWQSYGIICRNVKHDTMLMHHALQPESLKGLGFLGSVYTNEASWKLMNRKSTTIKRDD